MRILVASLLLLFAGMCALYVYGCEDPPVAPERRLELAATLSGRVRDQISRASLAGVRVSAGSSSAVSDSRGRFSLAGVSDGERLELRAPGIVSRTTYAALSDSIWGVVPASFDTAALRELARSYASSGRTIRWTSRPTVYIDVRAHGAIAPTDLARWIDETAAAIPRIVSGWSSGTVPVRIVRTAAPPAFPTPGALVVRFSELSSHYGGGAFVGYARVWWDSSYRVVSGDVSLRYREYRADSTKRRGILGHELGHTMGYRHTSAASLMQASIGRRSDLLPLDRAAARFLYGRVPANRAPDVDSRQRIGLRLAGGGYWEGE